jgi:hypothetical protein
MDVEINQVQELSLPSTPPIEAQESTPEMPIGPKRRGRKPGVKNKPKSGMVQEDAKRQLHLMTVAVFGMFCALLIHDPELQPQDEEYDAILGPLENIILRRYSVSGMLSPDANDLLMLAMGVSMYGIRVYQVSRAKHPNKPVSRPVPVQRASENGNINTSNQSPVNSFPGIGENFSALDVVSANAKKHPGE